MVAMVTDVVATRIKVADVNFMFLKEKQFALKIAGEQTPIV